MHRPLATLLLHMISRLTNFSHWNEFALTKELYVAPAPASWDIGNEFYENNILKSYLHTTTRVCQRVRGLAQEAYSLSAKRRWPRGEMLRFFSLVQAGPKRHQKVFGAPMCFKVLLYCFQLL